MVAKDTIQSFLINDNARGCILRLEQSFVHTFEYHKFSPSLEHFSKEFIAYGFLMASSFHFLGIFSLQIKFKEGSLKDIFMQIKPDKTFKFYVSAADEVATQNIKINFAEVAKNGIFAFAISKEGEKKPYEGIIELKKEGLKATVESFFARSIQVGTSINYYSNGNKSFATLLQELPSKKDEQYKDDIKRYNLLLNTLKVEEIAQTNNEELLHLLFHEDKIMVSETEFLQFKCDCSTEKMAAFLEQISQKEQQQIRKKYGEIKFECGSCNKFYIFP